jgi:hypothetical protein
MRVLRFEDGATHLIVDTGARSVRLEWCDDDSFDSDGRSIRLVLTDALGDIADCPLNEVELQMLLDGVQTLTATVKHDIDI